MVTNMPACGYLYTLGSDKVALVFMETISSLPPNHISYTLKAIQQFFNVSKYLSKSKSEFSAYLVYLAYEACLKRASKYLTDDKQHSYLNNVLQTRVKKLFVNKKSGYCVKKSKDIN